MNVAAITNEKLAILGGPKAIEAEEPELFHWPIIDEAAEQAVLDVLRAGAMSQTGITQEFEQEYAAYQGARYALGHSSGTAALHGAMFGCGIGRGDEVIAPGMTYWASVLQVFSLGATPVFAEVEPWTLCIDTRDIERRITKRTKVIVAVHYAGYPADMDPIMAIAGKHGLKVIEDVSHAHGTLYKGRLVGAIGDVAGISLMSRKSLAIGEAGIMCTSNREIYERALAFGHYMRAERELTLPELKRFAGLPLGGYKYRMNQTCSAMGRVQLKRYPERMREIDKAMNRFCDLLEEVPGLRGHRPPKDSGSTKGGWYGSLAFYLPEELGGLPVEEFAEAVTAEGVRTGPGGNSALHLHPVMNEADVYNDGKPTRIAFAEGDVRQGPGSLPVCEGLAGRLIRIPYFKQDKPESIEQYSAAFEKVARQADKLG